MACMKNVSRGGLQTGSRRQGSTDSEERARVRKRANVGDEGQRGSTQDDEDVRKDDDIHSESEEDDDHGSEEADDIESEEEDEEDFEDPVHLEAIPKHRSTRRNTTSKKPTAPAPAPPIKPRGMPVHEGLVLEKRKRKHAKSYKVQNFKKMPRKDYIAERKVETKNATDSRFWSRVHQDIYESIILPQQHIVVPQRSINMEFIDKNSAIFPGCVEIIDGMGLRGILALTRDWSEEAVMQFFASCRFDTDEERTLVWSTEGMSLSVTFEEFGCLLNIPMDANLHRIHEKSATCESMTGDALDPLRRPNAVVTLDNAQSTCLLEPVYSFMHKVITRALVPKIGDSEKVRNFAIDLLVRMHTNDRSFPYAPFVQVLIDAKFPHKIFKDSKHKKWTPQASGTGETVAVTRSSNKKTAAREPSPMPFKFDKFMAKTQLVPFGICKSNADDIAEIKSIDREKLNKYKAQVRQLGGQASDDEVFASSSTARPKFKFPTKGYEEYFDNDSSDQDGGEEDGGDATIAAAH
ncbi:hypothetical protein ACQ4PT_061049 [Festuca glaucescens]